jgi:hypothetical protein
MMTPKTMKKNPPAFAANTGITGAPTTLSLVRPGPANWVCLLTTSKHEVKRESRNQDCRKQHDVQDVEPGDHLISGEFITEEQVGNPDADHGEGFDHSVDDSQTVSGEQVIGQE